MMFTTLPAGTPLKIWMFLKTLSAGMFSLPAMDASTTRIKLSRRTALMLSRRARAESESCGRGPFAVVALPGETAAPLEVVAVETGGGAVAAGVLVVVTHA